MSRLGHIARSGYSPIGFGPDLLSNQPNANQTTSNNQRKFYININITNNTEQKLNAAGQMFVMEQVLPHDTLHVIRNFAKI